MDYINFKKEWDQFNEWNGKEMQVFDSITEDEVEHPFRSDRVNSPSHYTSGKTEAIDVIEDAIKSAPDPERGFLQGQVLKYLLRLWLKDDPMEDAQKARWYLDRLIGKGDSAR